MTSKLKVKIEQEDYIADDDRYNVLTSFNGKQWSGGRHMSLEDIEELRDQLSAFLRIKVSGHDLGEALPEMLKQQAE